MILSLVLLLSSLLELTGLVLVIPYVDLMLSEQKLVEYSAKFPIIEPLLSMTGNYRLDASIWFGAFFVVKNVALTTLGFVQLSILKHIQINLMDRMHRRYLRESYAYHVNTRSSELVRSITYDALLFGDGVLAKGTTLIAELFLLFGVLVVLTLQNPSALIVMMAMIVPLTVIYALIKKRLYTWGSTLQHREAMLIQHLQEGIGGIKDVIVHNAQDYFEHKFRNNVEQRALAKRNRDVALLVPRFLIEAIIMVAMAAALVWIDRTGGLEENFSFIAFLAVVAVRLMPMSNRILTSFNNIRACSSSIDTVYANAHICPSEGNERGNPVPPNTDITTETVSFSGLDIQSLSFSYPGLEAIIKNVSFYIKQGETIGIVGSSGSGKTTIVDLLLGLLVPSHGHIFQDRRDISADLREWRNRIGYVQQSVFLLDATIKQNIAFGIEQHQIDQKRIEETIRLVKLDTWIEQLPQKLNSVVGERGVRISGGQRQRIGIARALYHDPEILVLDEATSALDNLTEKRIMDDIYSMQGDRTLIMIAHRLDTIRRCDRIIVLDQGQIVGQGTYDQLLDENTVFQRISAKEMHEDD